uniref:Interferon-induced, double-stranded RNA-activated protein kinase-like n=1 Tax=Poecilia latipinna TaxID=48699 RepID=A0A3B3W1I4_9TELE
MDSVNYIARLNEYAQKERLELKYEEVGCVGPDHIRTFTLKAVVNGKPYPEGVGKNKKEAKQSAAKNALVHLLNETSVSVKTNYMCWLNEYGQSNRLMIRAVEKITPGPNNLSQYCRFVVGDKEFPAAFGKTKKEAREEAARLVHHEILGNETLDVSSEIHNYNILPFSNRAKRLSLQSEDSILTETNFIGLVNSHCQKTRSTCAFVEDKRIGPPHNPIFSYKLLINNVQYSVGEGKSVKDAKQNAARLALSALKEQSDWDSKKVSIFSKIIVSLHFPKAITVIPTVKLYFLSPNVTDYESIEQLDKGAFGRVFKAKRKLEGKYYAVKIVRYKEKTLEEVKVLSELNHCNIVRYHSCWLEDTAYQWDASTDSSSFMKYLYIQMELCEIKTLRVWIDEKNIQNPKKSLRDSRRREESVDIMVQMVSGVEHIHTNKLIHRDLKPANIMFSQNGTVKIGDFGLVTSEIEDDAENQKERRGYKGTPSYMAPEQERRLYDRKVDIFALGLIFFELLWNIPTIHEKEKVRLFLCLVKHFFASLELQMIKSMLCEKPEERPEASKIKTDLEEHKRLLAELKIKQLDSKTVI